MNPLDPDPPRRGTPRQVLPPREPEQQPLPLNLNPSGSLVDAVQFVRRNLHRGVTCPACDQHAQAYRRPLYGDMVRFLGWLAERHNDKAGWIDTSEFSAKGGDYAKIAFFSLAEARTFRGALWRPTQLGLDFVNGLIAVPSYVVTYNGRLLGYSPSFTTFDEAKAAQFEHAKIACDPQELHLLIASSLGRP